MTVSETDTHPELSSFQKERKVDLSAPRRSRRASERHPTFPRRRPSVSVSPYDSDSTDQEDIRSKEVARHKRSRLSDKDKQSLTLDISCGRGSLSCQKQVRADHRDMLDSWVAPETKRVKRVDMEWDTWIAPELREGEERREKDTMARLRAKRAEKERKKRSRRTRYDARSVDSWIAPNSPSTPEKYEKRERKRSPDASSCKASKISPSPIKQNGNIQDPENPSR